jgi:hypothetical protein
MHFMLDRHSLREPVSPYSGGGETPVPLFSRRKEHEVHGFMLKVVNNHCSELESLVEGPRLDGRVRLTIVVLITPLFRRQPCFEQTFAAVTKEFSAEGVSLVVREPRALDEMFLGFRWESDMKYVRAQAKHLNPMGAGFYQLGVQVLEVIHPGDYPGLAELRF